MRTFKIFLIAVIGISPFLFAGSALAVTFDSFYSIFTQFNPHGTSYKATVHSPIFPFELSTKVCIMSTDVHLQTSGNPWWKLDYYFSKTDVPCGSNGSDVPYASQNNNQSYSTVDLNSLADCCCAQTTDFAKCGFHFTYNLADKAQSQTCGAAYFSDFKAPGVNFTYVDQPLKPGQTCKAYDVYKNGCCCQVNPVTQNGVTTKTTTCKPLAPYLQSPNSFVLPATCDAAFFNAAPVDAEQSSPDNPLPNATYQFQNFPQSGDCSELEHGEGAGVGVISKGSGLGQTLQSLQIQARDLNKVPYSTIPQIIGQIIGFFFWVIGSVSFALYVYAGALYMTSEGNSETTGRAKTIFVWTTLGLLAMFGSYIVISELIKFISTGQIV